MSTAPDPAEPSTSSEGSSSHPDVRAAADMNHRPESNPRDESNSISAVVQLPTISPLRRAIYIFLGVLFVGIAAVGVFLPGIPTAGPLIVASIFLTKSNPALEQKLIRNNKFFAKYLPYLDGTTEMSPKAKLTSIALMWLSISISCGGLYLTGQGYWWLLSPIILAGVVGTFFIRSYGKKRSP